MRSPAASCERTPSRIWRTTSWRPSPRGGAPPEEALTHLARSVALSPEAGAQARFDADFESLRAHDDFRRLTDPSSLPSGLTSAAAPLAVVPNDRIGRMALHVVVLAAGKGTRMKSVLPKVLHPLAGRPIIEHVLRTVDRLEAESTVLVVGHGGDDVRAALADRRPARRVRRAVATARDGSRAAADRAGPGRQVRHAAPSVWRRPAARSRHAATSPRAASRDHARLRPS